MDLVEDLVKIAWPHIKTIMDEFDKHVKPILDEMVDYALQLVNGLLDIVDPLINLLTPIIKVIWKILWFFIEKALSLLFKLLGFVWMLVRPVIKAALWLLTKLPDIINGLADWVAGFLSFQWAKDWMSNVLKGIHWVVLGLSEMKFIGGAFKGAAESLEGMIVALQPAPQQMGPIAPTQIAITNEVNGIKEPTEQESFDSSANWQAKYKNQIDLSGDVNTWQPSFST